MAMRSVNVNVLKGNEILAKDILTASGIILMSEGTVIKKEYISKLIELGITNVFIKDELAMGIKVDELTEMKIKEQCQETVKETIEKYFFSDNSELEKLKVVADEIIFDILNEPEVMFNISGVRKKNEVAYSHSVNVCALSVLIALKLKLSQDKVRDIAVGSLLHDIGFNYLNFDVHNETYESIYKDEIKVKEMKKHVIYGYTSVEKETWLSAVAKDIILSHHERIDGSGYPFHLVGNKIKIGSKIVGVCDEFDHLVYGLHGEKMKVYKAIDYIISQSGVKFDYEIVKIFNESVAAYPTGSTVITSDKDIAIVLRQNTKCPTRPVIRLIMDRTGRYYDKWIELDLTKELTLFIEDTKDI
ncbi:HD-GYP domain-containing protein [Anaerosporobacter faecicola]|uniref:HD-GYP domain-containing protein n=1 Tax=Anaerosporobacter faecicola TaxID=2718714 RepID=UPI001439905F|nr:HD domain-containing phosphohydrolase [Anaerosporobacter faecicola]